jgi:hypothetical protein
MKTLFCEAPGRTGVLISQENGKHKRKVMRFKDAHAALDWCESNGVSMVYLPVDSRSSQN